MSKSTEKEFALAHQLGCEIVEFAGKRGKEMGLNDKQIFATILTMARLVDEEMSQEKGEGGMTFAQHLERAGEYKYELEERAAILEFDGGLTRAEAEIRAAREWPEQLNRYRFAKLREEAGI